MTPTMTIDVEVRDRVGAVRKVAGLPATYTQTHYITQDHPMADEFKKLLGDQNARVSVGVDERFSGPSGTYSSASVRVSISLNCDQNKETIDAATKLAFEYASDFLDRHAVPSAKLLSKHLKEVYNQPEYENGG